MVRGEIYEILSFCWNSPCKFVIRFNQRLLPWKSTYLNKFSQKKRKDVDSSFKKILSQPSSFFRLFPIQYLQKTNEHSFSIKCLYFENLVLKPNNSCWIHFSQKSQLFVVVSVTTCHGLRGNVMNLWVLYILNHQSGRFSVFSQTRRQIYNIPLKKHEEPNLFNLAFSVSSADSNFFSISPSSSFVLFPIDLSHLTSMAIFHWNPKLVVKTNDTIKLHNILRCVGNLSKFNSQLFYFTSKKSIRNEIIKVVSAHFV